jgi:SAM-dependent methyltransferase
MLGVMSPPATGTPTAAPSPLATPEPWDLVAEAYTEELLRQFELYARDALRLAEVPPGGRVLDVATGPGTLALLAAGAGAKVSALDFSPHMIEQLRRRVAAGGGAALDVRVGDGQALPFPDDAFDGAFSLFGLIFFPDRARGFRELARVLRPGRRAVVSSWAPFEGPFAHVMEAIRTMLPGLPFGQGKAPLGARDEMAAEMAAGGFFRVDVHEATHTLGAPSVDRFWSTVQRTTAPVVLLRRRLGEAKWAEVSAGVLDELRRRCGDGSVEAVGRAWLGVGVK